MENSSFLTRITGASRKMMRMKQNEKLLELWPEKLLLSKLKKNQSRKQKKKRNSNPRKK
jgi:hypothetical protein